ncbi:hypothetical protein [Streptomyces virginiae]
MSRQRIRWPAVVDRARQIVEGYEGGVTLRQVMDRLASEGVLPHTPSMYRHLSSHLARARREGRFPDLIDTLREVHVLPARPDAATFLRESVDWFGLDRTAGRQHALYVAAEKDTPTRSARPATRMPVGTSSGRSHRRPPPISRAAWPTCSPASVRTTAATPSSHGTEHYSLTDRRAIH